MDADMEERSSGEGRAETIGNLVCDLDGVVYLADQPVPGAADALARLERGGWRILFVTNNSYRTREETAAKVRRVTGYGAQPEQVVNSAMAAAVLVADAQPRSLVVGGSGIVEALIAVGAEVTDRWSEAEAVVMGFDPELTYGDLRDATLAVGRGARFVATNADRTFPTPEGPWPGAGALVAAVATATGVTPEVAGKPHPPMVALVSSRLGPGPTVVVGDRPDTDIALAKAGGWRSVLTLTGIVRDPDEVPSELAPDLVVGSLADLPDRIGELLAAP